MQRQVRFYFIVWFGLLCGLVCLSMSHIVVAQTQEKIVETNQVKLSYQQLEENTVSTIKLKITVKDSVQDPIVGIKLTGMDLQKFKPIKNEQIIDTTDGQIELKLAKDQKDYQISFEQVGSSDLLSFSILILTQKENENQNEL